MVILVIIGIHQEYTRKSRFATLTQCYYLKGILEEITYKDLLYRIEKGSFQAKKGVYKFNEGNVNYTFLDNSIRLDTVLSNGLSYSENYKVELSKKEVTE